jgi:prepilin-type N-terminal cleavage/methylation domain-containing protein
MSHFSGLRRCAHNRGFTVLEILLTLSIAATIMAIAVPLTTDALDEVRTGMAARYLEARVVDARLHAVKRSTHIGLRFESLEEDYRFGEYVDGNGNGVRTADISAGVDAELAPRRLLRDSFSGVRFGLQANLPDVDGSRSSSAGDGVRIGTSRILSLGPDGTATSGTLYLHGRRSQYAVRILGATGRTRVLRFNPGGDQWIAK